MPTPGPWMVPVLLLGSGGRVMEPGADGPEEARTPNGAKVDLFDFADYLSDRFRRIYVIDLDGLDRNRPQLDYLQELTKDTDVWIDAGVPDADAVIDIVVAGARRAVVSTLRFDGPDELDRALALTPELVLEVELDAAGVVVGRPSWGSAPIAIAERARASGVPDLIVSPPDDRFDRPTIERIAQGGPVWIAGACEPDWGPRIAEASATGGLFPSSREIIPFVEHSANK
jgi:Histidine biosynthesis protein